MILSEASFLVRCHSMRGLVLSQRHVAKAVVITLVFEDDVRSDPVPDSRLLELSPRQSVVFGCLSSRCKAVERTDIKWRGRNQDA